MSNNQQTNPPADKAGHRQNYLKFSTWKLGFVWILGFVIWNLKITSAFAQGNDGTVDIGSKVSGFFGFKCITEFVFQIVDVAIISSGILLLVYLVYGGVEWLVSSGDKAKVESARAKITNALIGVAIIAASFAIWKVALTFFGIDAPNICSDNPLGPPRMDFNPNI